MLLHFVPTTILLPNHYPGQGPKCWHPLSRARNTRVSKCYKCYCACILLITSVFWVHFGSFLVLPKCYRKSYQPSNQQMPLFGKRSTTFFKKSPPFSKKSAPFSEKSPSFFPVAFPVALR